jgi:CRP-like cAMP-binding protein
MTEDKNKYIQLVKEHFLNKYNVEDNIVNDILSRCLISRFQKNDFICKQGVKNKYVFIIAEGKAKVIFDNTILAKVHVGDIIGEMSIMGKEKATANVVAISDIITFKMLKEKFVILLNKYPSFNKLIVSQTLDRKNEQNDLSYL